MLGMLAAVLPADPQADSWLAGWRAGVGWHEPAFAVLEQAVGKQLYTVGGKGWVEVVSLNRGKFAKWRIDVPAGPFKGFCEHMAIPFISPRIYSS